MKEHPYTGAPRRALVPVALHNGWLDAGAFRRFEQLYRAPRRRRALYAIGFYLGRLFGRRPR